MALSVCPSVCGWKAVLRLRDIPSASVTRLQKSEVNRDPLSDTILLGSPWGLITCWRKWSARSSGVHGTLAGDEMSHLCEAVDYYP